jgi:hypothetical protein
MRGELDVGTLRVRAQLQPGGQGPGWWPNASAYVTISNVTLRDINATNGIWFWPVRAHREGVSLGLRQCCGFTGVVFPAELQGAFRANATNPFTNITLDNVYVEDTYWNASATYICENTEGQVFDSWPVPDCFNATPSN